MTFALPKKGDPIQHEILGRGVVTEVRGAREGDHDITIKFSGRAQPVTLMWSFACAKLRVVKGIKA